MAGSTGVHDTVVNQLLSKLDGVEQLNNILVIGTRTHTHTDTQTSPSSSSDISMSETSILSFFYLCLLFSPLSSICPSFRDDQQT